MPGGRGGARRKRLSSIWRWDSFGLFIPGLILAVLYPVFIFVTCPINPPRAPPEIEIQQIDRGIVPFVLSPPIGLGLVIAFPDLAMWQPNKILD